MNEQKQLWEYYKNLTSTCLARVMYDDDTLSATLAKTKSYFDDFQAYTQFSIEQGLNYIKLKGPNNLYFAPSPEFVRERQDQYLQWNENIEFEMFVGQIAQELAEYDRF